MIKDFRLQCVIVDDDTIDAMYLAKCLKAFKNLDVIATFHDPLDAIDFHSTHLIDILFLDIDMGDVNGIEARKLMMSVPVCIFITSHPEYAFDSYGVDALDFISKPIDSLRLKKAIDKSGNFFTLKHKADLFEMTIGNEIIFIKDGNAKYKINFFEVIYIKGMKNYTKIITKDKQFSVYSSIGQIINSKPFDGLLRTHKSYAVQSKFIKKVIGNKLLLIDDTEIPIGRKYKPDIDLN